MDDFFGIILLLLAIILVIAGIMTGAYYLSLVLG